MNLTEYLNINRLIKEFAIVDNILWTLQEHTNGSFITSYLVSNCENDLREGRSEGRTPHGINCPKRFLDMVRVVNPKWRKEVMAFETPRRRRR